MRTRADIRMALKSSSPSGGGHALNRARPIVRAILRVVAKSRRLHLDPHRTPRVDSRTVMNDRDCLTGRSAGHQTQKTQAVESASNRRLPTANDSYG